MERAVQPTPTLQSLGAAFAARADSQHYVRWGLPKRFDNAQKLAPNSAETLFALGYYQYQVLGDFRAAEETFVRVSKMYPGKSEVLLALSRVTRRQEHWDATIAYSEQALGFNPRNVELLMDVAITYAHLRQFPTALKLYDRVLDITPNDPDVMASKAKIYQAQGNLPEAARLLAKFDWQTRNGTTFQVKITQLTLERNYAEAIRLLQTRLAQFHYVGSEDNETDNQLTLAMTQRLADDMAGARVSAQQALKVRAAPQRATKRCLPCDGYVSSLWR
jgi:tetratricopeptide (TPR) repeat protein